VDCLELADAPEWSILQVAHNLTGNDLRITVKVHKKSTSISFAGLVVKPKMARTESDISRQCALEFALIGQNNEPLTRNIPLRRNSGMFRPDSRDLGTLSGYKWNDIGIRLTTQQGADCGLVTPGRVYRPHRNHNALDSMVEVDSSTGVGSISPDLYTTRPDVIVVLSSFLGTDDVGQSVGSHERYPLKQEALRETTTVFLEEVFTFYRPIADRIQLYGFKKDGNLEMLDTIFANALSTTEPSTMARKYAAQVQFPRRDYDDTHVNGKAMEVMSADNRKNARHLIVFGRSGFFNDQNFCEEYSIFAEPNTHTGDKIAVLDFVGKKNVETERATRGNVIGERYPAADCKGNTRMHWVFYPESMDKLVGPAHRKDMFTKFLTPMSVTTPGVVQ
jgi:hypothetical protein